MLKRAVFLIMQLILLISSAPSAYGDTSYGRYINTEADGCSVFVITEKPNLTAQWSGACSNGFAEGQGILKVYSSGSLVRTLDVWFTNGKADGPGSETNNENGTVYNGPFRGGYWQGIGALHSTIGIDYTGTFYHGEKTYGAIHLPDGKSFNGSFDNDLPVKGTVVLSDGTVCSGHGDNRPFAFSCDDSSVEFQKHTAQASPDVPVRPIARESDPQQFAVHNDPDDDDDTVGRQIAKNIGSGPNGAKYAAALAAVGNPYAGDALSAAASVQPPLLPPVLPQRNASNSRPAQATYSSFPLSSPSNAPLVASMVSNSKNSTVQDFTLLARNEF